MSRPIVLSNGEMHVGLDSYGLVNDFYYPYVGLENHTAGPDIKHRVGVWVEGGISWLDDGSWDITMDYFDRTLVGSITAINHKKEVLLKFSDAVDSSVNAFVRNVHVINLSDRKRDVRVFMHQAFAIGDGRTNTDTAQYLPDSKAILHYRGRRAFVASGTIQGKPFDQYTIGLFGIEGRQGTYRDADDGELSMSNVEHGRVDSTIRFRLELEPCGSGLINYWLAAGTSLREALYVNKHVAETEVPNHLDETSAHWEEWLKPAIALVNKLDPKYQSNFLKSVLILRTQIDNRGAIMASTDTTMLNYSRDAYAYCWPRDGAYVVWPLIRMGYVDEPRRFFEFAKQGLHPSGYLVHKYRADGAIGSSWHPYIHDGIIGPPIQEDETATTLFMFAQFYQQQKSAELLEQFYKSMVVPMANFLADYIEPVTGLPKPSYDLWEEVYLTTTYTTAVTYAALLVAADLADAVNDEDNAVRWRSVAGDITESAKKYLYNDSRKSFYKGLIVKDGEIHYNETIDTSSIFGATIYGLFAFDGDEVKSAVATAEKLYQVSKASPGAPRYEDDNYYRQDRSVLGNWWVITSLWFVQYYRLIGDYDRVNEVLDWVTNLAGPTGILPEQVNPIDGSFVSVAPLTWSHAEYLSTLLDTISK